MSDKVREQFEADANLRWHPDAKGPGLLDRDPADGYYNTAVEYAWRAWQASRAAALEEAAKVCDDEAAEWEAQVEAAGKLSSITKHAVESTAVGARRCARRISALAGSGA